MLTLPEILDAGYALLFEENMRIGGKDLVSVWEDLAELRGTKPQNGKPLPAARENDQALQQLQQLMGGVKLE